MRDVNKAGLELVKKFEGIPDGDPTTVKIDPYMDPVGIWTIGWGHAIRAGSDYLRGRENRRVAMNMYPGGITIEQAEQLLRGDLLDVCRDVGFLVEKPCQRKFSATRAFAGKSCKKRFASGGHR